MAAIINRKPIFDAVRDMLGRGFSDSEVRRLDRAIDKAIGVTDGRVIGPKGIDLIKRWEGLRLEAYPDPGTGGKPWTIGYGATTDEQGKPITPGTVWTQDRADARLEAHLKEFAAGVEDALDGASATQEQFDAMASLAYNIGTPAFTKSTLLRKHKKGDFIGAAKEFGRWVNAGGKRLQGLVNRRAEEAALYRAGS